MKRSVRAQLLLCVLLSSVLQAKAFVPFDTSILTQKTLRVDSFVAKVQPYEPTGKAVSNSTPLYEGCEEVSPKVWKSTAAFAKETPDPVVLRGSLGRAYSVLHIPALPVALQTKQQACTNPLEPVSNMLLLLSCNSSVCSLDPCIHAAIAQLNTQSPSSINKKWLIERNIPNYRKRESPSLCQFVEKQTTEQDLLCPSSRALDYLQTTESLLPTLSNSMCLVANKQTLVEQKNFEKTKSVYREKTVLNSITNKKNMPKQYSTNFSIYYGRSF